MALDSEPEATTSEAPKKDEMLDAVKSKLNQAEDEAAEARKKLAEAREDMDKKEKEAIEPRRDYDEKKQAFDELNKRMTLIEAAKESDEAFTASNESFTAAESKLNDANSTLITLRNEVKAAEDRLVDARAEEAGNKTARPTLKTANDDAKLEMDRKLKVVDGIKTRIRGLERDCKSRPSECSLGQATIASLRGQQGPAQTEYDTAKGDYETAKAAYTKCNDDLTNLRGEIPTLMQTAGKSDEFPAEDVADAVEELRLAREDLTERQTALDKANKAIAEFRSDVPLIEEKVEDARADLDKAEFLKNQIDEKETALRSLIAQLELQSTQAEARVGALQQEYQKKLKENKTGLG